MARARAKFAPPKGTVRLTMAASVAGNLDALQRSLKSLAERLGHPQCATGCDILHLMMEREFTVDQKVALNPQPLPPRDDLTHVVVTMPEKVNNDIGALTKAVERVLGKLGCPACCSGFDILFRRELDVIRVNERLDVEGFGRFA